MINTLNASCSRLREWDCVQMGHVSERFSHLQGSSEAELKSDWLQTTGPALS